MSTMLGRSRFFANALDPKAGNNAAPALAPVTLNFDLVINEPPVGDNLALCFEVLPPAPPSNDPPVGQNVTLDFDVG